MAANADYNHSAGSLHEGCGYSAEEMAELVKKANDLAKPLNEKEDSSASEVVEAFENNFEKRDLAILFFAYSVEAQKSKAELEALTSVMELMTSLGGKA